MKTQTIWESASRPLFVRSVWLESTREGRGVQHRHFLLDYETQKQVQQQGQQTRSAFSPVRKWRTESLRHAISCDLSEISASNESETSADDLLLVGSAKIKLQHQPIHQYNRQQLKLVKFYRRPSFTSATKKHASNPYEFELNRRMRELQELYSRHSSLQDMQSTLSNAYSNPEERLAERVLNWLDLANKGGLVKGCENESPIDIMETEAAAALQQQQAFQRASVAANQSRRRTNIVQMQNTNNRAYSNNNNSFQQSNNKRFQRDAVKPITIIFNREGFPVRFNRPARNIDLCALASSAGTTRRLAGTLASVRLYKGNKTSPYKTSTLKPPTITTTTAMQQQSTTRTPLRMTRSRSGDVEKIAPQSSQKRLLEDYVASTHMQDSKRQLHIFMPSLPKRGMASPSVLSNCTGDDNAVNVLSHNFNEHCKL